MTIAVCAVICGANGWTVVETFGCARWWWNYALNKSGGECKWSQGTALSENRLLDTDNSCG
ncbi:helix-turn-helix domain-containing protein [Nostoc sp.]|uniref:helix-turn-helix domain-containing protein n=1 Tax=Nostoc sp. TaxID=1180 RepID=UPI0035942D5C